MSGAVKGRVDLDATRSALERLGLVNVASGLEGFINEAVKENLPPHRFLDQLLGLEQSQREERRIRTSLKLSGLPTVNPFEL